jgi:hypothetical protein
MSSYISFPIILFFSELAQFLLFLLIYPILVHLIFCALNLFFDKFFSSFVLLLLFQELSIYLIALLSVLSAQLQSFIAFARHAFSMGEASDVYRDNILFIYLILSALLTEVAVSNIRRFFFSVDICGIFRYFRGIFLNSSESSANISGIFLIVPI